MTDDRDPRADDPAALYGAAESLYEAVRHAPSQELARKEIENVIRMYGRSVEAYVRRGDTDAALGPASMGIAVINTWKAADWYDTAMDWAQRLVLDDERPRDAVPMARLLIANNILSTCGALGYADLSLRYATILRDDVDRCPELLEQPAFALDLHEQAFRGCIIARMNLLRKDSQRLEALGPSIWTDLGEYESWSRGTGDLDVRKRAAELKQRVHWSLLDLDRDWTLRRIGAPPPDPSEATANLGERLERRRLAGWSAAGSAASREDVRALLDGLYASIGDALRVLVEELGLNLHICRALTFLGGIASGRLLPSLFTTLWLLPHSEQEVVPEGSRGTIFRRQNDIALWRMDREVELLLALTELAAVVESLQRQAEIAPFVRLQLRDHNARLLRSLMPGPRLMTDTKVPADDDLRALVDGVSPAGAARVWEGYGTGEESAP